MLIRGLEGSTKSREEFKVGRMEGWREEREEREGGSSNGSSPVVFHLRLHYAVTARGFSPSLRSEELT